MPDQETTEDARVHENRKARRWRAARELYERLAPGDMSWDELSGHYKSIFFFETAEVFDLRDALKTTRKESGRLSQLVGNLRAELARVREETSKIERGDLRWAERQVEILREQHKHDLMVIERQREEMAKLQRPDERELRRQLWGLVLDWSKEKSDPVTEHALGTAAKELKVMLTYPEATPKSERELIDTTGKTSDELADEAEVGYEVPADA